MLNLTSLSDVHVFLKLALLEAIATLHKSKGSLR